MTENHGPASTPPTRGESPLAVPAGEQGIAETVEDRASDLSHASVQSGRHGAGVAGEEASRVAAGAGRQGRDLLRQAQDQLGAHADHGQQRLAAGLVSLSDDLHSMADGHVGVAASLAHHAASRICAAGQWLNSRKASEVADKVQFPARRKPTVYLVLAAGAGLVTGRLTGRRKHPSVGDSGAARVQDRHQGAGCGVRPATGWAARAAHLKEGRRYGFHR
jgi:hypothetical protein